MASDDGQLRHRAAAVTPRTLRLDVPIDSDEDARALRSALLSARASELAEMRRRSDRLGWGYGSDSAREGMTAEVGDRERRWQMLDRLLSALDAGTSPSDIEAGGDG